jgi:hypothetical protein
MGKLRAKEMFSRKRPGERVAPSKRGALPKGSTLGSVLRWNGERLRYGPLLGVEPISTDGCPPIERGYVRPRRTTHQEIRLAAVDDPQRKAALSINERRNAAITDNLSQHIGTEVSPPRAKWQVVTSGELEHVRHIQHAV